MIEKWNINEYQKLAQKTSNVLLHGTPTRKLIAGLGLAGEAGEIADIIKKEIGHGHPENAGRIKDECGDLLWYIAETASAYGLSLSDIAQHNIDKLRSRYPEGFSAERSVNRVD